MQDNPEGVELDHKKNFSVLSCIDKRTKEGCDRGSDVGTVISGRGGKVPLPLRKQT